MTNTFKGLGIVALMFVSIFALIQFTQHAYGSIAVDNGANTNSYRLYNLMAASSSETTIATTTTATSTNIGNYFDSSGRLIDGTVDLRGAKKVAFYFARGGATHANTGNTVFKVEVSPDGTNWYTFSKLRQSTSTTEDATVTITAATTTLVYGMNIDYGGYKAARCITVITTDGESSCAAAVTY